MNHPDREELIEFLYDGLPADRRDSVCGHVESCAECQMTVDSWRGVRRQLQTAEVVDEPRLRKPAASAVLRWAVAASVLMGVGYGLARLTAPVDLPRARADDELRGQFRQELHAELAKFTADQAARQQEYQLDTARLINQLATRQLADYSGLRKDVETVAMRTQEEFDRLATSETADTKPPERRR